MKIIFKDETEIENISFQETGANKTYNGTITFGALTNAEVLDKIFTNENVSEMVLKTDNYETTITGYKLGSITVNYTDKENYVRVMLSKSTAE